LTAAGPPVTDAALVFLLTGHNVVHTGNTGGEPGTEAVRKHAHRGRGREDAGAVRQAVAVEREAERAFPSMTVAAAQPGSPRASTLARYRAPVVVRAWT